MTGHHWTALRSLMTLVLAVASVVSVAVLSVLPASCDAYARFLSPLPKPQVDCPGTSFYSSIPTGLRVSGAGLQSAQGQGFVYMGGAHKSTLQWPGSSLTEAQAQLVCPAGKAGQGAGLQQHQVAPKLGTCRCVSPPVSLRLPSSPARSSQ